MGFAKRGIRCAYRGITFRSLFERETAKEIYKAGLPLIYEKERITFTVPAKDHHYTPDFKIERPDGITFYIEVKGVFDGADRRKHKCIKKQHPDVDIRFLFKNASRPINTGSKTSYGDWCDQQGITWASGSCPVGWLYG